MERYTWMMERDAALLYETLAAPERRRHAGFSQCIGRHPLHEGHMRDRDHASFECRAYLIGEFDLYYRLDHAVREVRVCHLERHPPLVP